MSHPEEPLRDQIIRTALELFHEKGYHTTSLREIISTARCSKGGFYHHFASKEDLLYLIHETFISYELDRGDQAYRSPGTATSRLRKVIIDLILSIELYRPHVTVFFEERRSMSSAKFSLLREKRDQYEQIVLDLIAEGIRTGEFRPDMDQRVACFAIFGMCNWTYQWYRPGGRKTAQEIGEMFSDMILGGLMAPGR